MALVLVLVLVPARGRLLLRLVWMKIGLVVVGPMGTGMGLIGKRGNMGIVMVVVSRARGLAIRAW